jgi:hypothetical protein
LCGLLLVEGYVPLVHCQAKQYEAGPAGTFTLLFTAYDTGITINLPPTDQMQSGA